MRVDLVFGVVATTVLDVDDVTADVSAQSRRGLLQEENGTWTGLTGDAARAMASQLANLLELQVDNVGLFRSGTLDEKQYLSKIASEQFDGSGDSLPVAFDVRDLVSPAGIWGEEFDDHILMFVTRDEAKILDAVAAIAKLVADAARDSTIVKDPLREVMLADI